ncbi:MAG: DNA-processing protein DprA, partial [Sphingomonadales bacterium]|nr:DNA-processing protein DprA [Sphingomonadales bacterium]
CPQVAALREIEAAQAIDASYLIWGDDDYPEHLAHIDDAPPVLLTRGHRHLFNQRSIAVVGSRNASAVGRRLAHDFSRALGKAGFVITSGLASGIDAAAHNGGIETGTIAVLGGGIDHIYPRENAELYERVINEGLLISEHGPGIKPQASFFPRRNRIVSGLSVGVLVVEAAEKSGSLISARLAGEQGREVFAIPGSPMDPRAKGTNRLIREGALLVDCADDIIDALTRTAHRGFESMQSSLFDHLPVEDDGGEPSEADQAHIVDLLSPTPIALDEIVRQSELTASTVLTILLELELAGVAIRGAGNMVSRV